MVWCDTTNFMCDCDPCWCSTPLLAQERRSPACVGADDTRRPPPVPLSTTSRAGLDCSAYITFPCLLVVVMWERRCGCRPAGDSLTSDRPGSCFGGNENAVVPTRKYRPRPCHARLPVRSLAALLALCVACCMTGEAVTAQRQCRSR